MVTSLDLCYHFSPAAKAVAGYTNTNGLFFGVVVCATLAVFPRCFSVFHLDNHGSWEHERRFCLCSIPLVDFIALKQFQWVLIHLTHACLGLFGKNQHVDFHNLSSKSAISDFPFTLYVLARHYTTGGGGGGYAAAIFPLGEYGVFQVSQELICHGLEHVRGKKCLAL